MSLGHRSSGLTIINTSQPALVNVLAWIISISFSLPNTIILNSLQFLRIYFILSSFIVRVCLTAVANIPKKCNPQSQSKCIFTSYFFLPEFYSETLGQAFQVSRASDPWRLRLMTLPSSSCDFKGCSLFWWSGRGNAPGGTHVGGLQVGSGRGFQVCPSSPCRLLTVKEMGAVVRSSVYRRVKLTVFADGDWDNEERHQELCLPEQLEGWNCRFLTQRL